MFILKASTMNPLNINSVFTERQGNNKEDKELPCLDKFLAKNTSEDNALFEHIMDLAKQKEKVKHSWLYEAEAEFKEVRVSLLSHLSPSEYFRKETYLLYLKYLKIIACHLKRHEQNLALQPIEKAALECVKAGLETWEYKAKNALMYYPEGKYVTVTVNRRLQEWT